MTTTTSTTMQQRTIDERVAGAIAVLVAAAAMAPANFATSAGENGGAAEYAAMLGLCVAVAAGVFGFVLPRVERPGRAALWLAGLAVVLLPAFWSGLPIILGAGAVVAGSRAGKVVPVVVGAVAIVLTVVGCLVG